MTLYLNTPVDLPTDRSIHKTIQFISQADQTQQYADMYLPSSHYDSPLPVILAPHPITWTAKEDYHGGLTGLFRGYHPGWYGLAEKYKVAVVMPHGHHRREENCSLASPEQIADMVQLIDELEHEGVKFDRSRVYACGLSMGGQEALVLSGKFPHLITAVVAFNPIVDLAVWQKALANSPVDEIREFGTDQRIIVEVGGTTDEVPELYRERSANYYIEGLSSVPTLIYWSEKDIIVPDQESQHAYHLYSLVKRKSKLSPMAEFNHTKCHGISEFNITTRWQIHEWCDYDLALKWLLTISKN